MSLYSDFDMIARFFQDIGFSSIGHKEEILEPCSEIKRANMATVGGSFAYYFYLYLPIIHKLEVLIPFTPFEEDFWRPLMSSLPKLRPTYEVSSGLSRSFVVI